MKKIETAQDFQSTETEDQFQNRVLQLAETFGWSLQYHTHIAYGSRRGFPDLVLVHEVWKRTLFAELKVNGKQPSQSQNEWLDALATCGQEVYLWDNSEWDEIVDVLSHPERSVTGAPTFGVKPAPVKVETQLYDALENLTCILFATGHHDKDFKRADRALAAYQKIYGKRHNGVVVP